MKKLLIMIMVCLIGLSSMVVPASALTPSEPQTVTTINVPANTTFTTLIRSIQNVFRGLFRAPLLTVSVNISDGPQVELLPDGVNAGYTIYYYNSNVSGRQPTSGHTSVDKDGSYYVVVVTSDGFVSTAQKIFVDIKEADPVPEEPPVPQTKTYTVTYNANGGKNIPAAQTKTENEDVVISIDIPAKYGFVFVEWNTHPDGIGASFFPGQINNINASLTLYAIWEKAPDEPATPDEPVSAEPEWVYYVEGNRIVIMGLANEDECFDAVLPAEIYGLPITKIGYEAFKGNKTLKSITIESDEIELAPYAFQQCTSLETVVFTGQYAHIEGFVFGGCTSLQAIEFPDETNYGLDIFSGCTSLRSFTVPKSVRYLNASFAGCNSLQEVTMYSNVEAIDVNAFLGCTSLQTINYTGTEEEWLAIEGRENVPESVTINYNYKI